MGNTILKLASAQSDCLQSCLLNGGNTNCNSICASAPGTDKGITNPALGALGNQSGFSFFQKLIPNLISLALIIGALIFVFMLITGAIAWISSGGDKQSLETARGKITSALVGLVILLAVFAIIKLIEVFFGISILALDIGSLVIQ